jgi:hypothetical protein
MHGTKPLRKLPEQTFPLLDVRRIFLAAVFPDIAMNATGIAPFGDEKPDRNGTAQRGQPATRYSS